MKINVARVLPLFGNQMGTNILVEFMKYRLARL